MSKDIHHHITPPPFAPIPPYDGHPHPFPHRHEAPRNHSARFRPMMLHPHIPHHFNFWCNKVIPLAYDDSLSYYEVLAKVADYLNNMLNDEKMMMINVEELAQAFCELQGFVNDYFAFYQSKGIINFEAAITNDNYLEILPDADNAQMNTVYRMQFVEGSTQNVPANLPESAKPYNHEAVLFNLSNFVVKRVGNEWLEITDDNKEYSTKGNYQLFITDRDIYFRENNGDTWGDWNSIFANWWSSEFENVKTWVREYVTPLVNDLSARIAAEVARATAAEQALDTKIEAETSRATAAENALSQRLVAEYERAAARENELEQAIEDETDRAEQVEGNLQTAIQTETTRATNAESAIRTDLNAEVTRATARENEISGDIADVARDLSEEIVDRQQADENLQDSIGSVAQGLATETQRAQGIEQQLSNEIAAEVQRAQGAEQDITTMVQDGYIPNGGNTKTGGLSLTRDSFYFGGSGSNNTPFTINASTFTFNLPSSAPLLYVTPSGNTFTTPIINVGSSMVELAYSSQNGAVKIDLLNSGKAYYLNPDNPTISDSREIAVMGVVGNMLISLSNQISENYIPNLGNTVSANFTLNRTTMRLISGETRLDLTNGGGLLLTNNQIELGRATVGAISLRGNNAYLYRTDSEIQSLSSNSDYEIVRRSDLAGYAQSSALDGYIPNEGNVTEDDMSIERSVISLISGDGEHHPHVYMDSDGVEIAGYNTNTKISVGYNGVDDIDIRAEDGAVTFVTDNITLQAADTDVTIGGDTDIKVYAGDTHNLTLESTDVTSIRAEGEINIYAPSNDIAALSFSTDCDVDWFNQPAVLSVYGSGLNSWNNFVNNVISASNNTHFKFGVENRTINIAANTTITNDNNASDYDNVLRFVNCTFNITNGNAFVEISGGKVEFENCNFVAPNYVNNKVSVTDYAYAVFKNCTFENVDVECKTDDNGAVFIMENCYCSHTLFLEPLENPTAPFKIINSYFDSNTFTIPTGETAINAIVTGCRFGTGATLSEIRYHWGNTNIGD